MQGQDVYERASGLQEDKGFTRGQMAGAGSREE